MKTNVRNVCLAGICAGIVLAGVGCSPAGIAIHVVGVAVDSIDAKTLGDELIGQPVAAANTKLGSPMDTWREVRGSRAWWTYPVKTDVLGNQRYVLEESRGRIASVSKVKIDGGGVEIAKKLALDQKAKGKSPQECEAALGMGRPLVTVRSDVTGRICQLYDAKIIKEVGNSQYCRVHFDANQRCDEVAIVDVAASAGDEPPR